MSDSELRDPANSNVRGRTACLRASLTAAVLGALFGLVIGLLVGASTAAFPDSPDAPAVDR